MSDETGTELLSLARLAIDRLGYIKADYDGTIAVLLEQSRHSGASAAASWFCGVGEQISLEEKRSLGLPSTARFSRAAYESLTDRGRMFALQAHPLTLTDALCRLKWRDAARAAEEQGTDRMKIIGPRRDCRACLGLSGRTLRAAEIELLPPAECDVELCQLLLRPWPEWLP